MSLDKDKIKQLSLEIMGPLQDVFMVENPPSKENVIAAMIALSNNLVTISVALMGLEQGLQAVADVINHSILLAKQVHEEEKNKYD